jgi:hypothetical protein
MRAQVVALVAALVLVVAVAGVARPGESAAEDSAGQSRLAELRERLAPELVRELDRAGRFVPLERLAARGALDALERPTQTDAPDGEETPRRAMPDDFIPPQRPFDIDQFEANIRDALDGLTVGYAYSIWQAGSLHSEDGVGYARVNPDVPETNQSASKAMTVASISKTITAVAVLRVLQQEGISVDAAIGPWLPSAWEPGEGVADITFRQLMTHTSGLLQNYQTATGTSGGQSTGSWDNIKIAIEQDLGSQTYRYANMNFSIFRIMLPKVAYGLDWSNYYHKPPPGVTPAHYDTLTGIIFEDYVQNLMAKAGAALGCSSVDPTPTRLYAFPTDGAAGWGPVSYITSCGGFGSAVASGTTCRPTRSPQSCPPCGTRASWSQRRPAL